jgi:hypothetical protein
VSSGAPTNVWSHASGNDVTVTWTAPDLRPSYTIASYQLVEQPGGRTLTAPASATRATFRNLPRGRHYVDVVVNYAGAERVAATPSNTVTTHGPPVRRRDTFRSPEVALGARVPDDLADFWADVFW